MDIRVALSGQVMFLAIVASLAHGFFSVPSALAGFLQLCVIGLVWSRIPLSVRLISSMLALVGGGAILMTNASSAVWLAAISKNQAIIAMFTAVGFLRIVPVVESHKAASLGKKALWQTMFGLNWFGAIINMSAIVLYGDRIAGKNKQLSPFQGMILSRGFAPAAAWSPFFVAMGVALTYAPGASITTLVFWGLPISQALLVALVWYTGRSPAEVADFAGYPLSAEALKGPIVLMIAVLVAHSIVPEISVLSIITLTVPLYALLSARKGERFNAFLNHIRVELPRMGSEVTLFLAAGVLGTGLGQLVIRLEIPIGFSSYDALSAMAGLAIILLFSGIGIHPVVGIAVVGVLFSQAGIDPNLLALSFLMGWSLGILSNPLSSVTLLLAGRYRCPFRLMWKKNFVAVILCYCLCSLWLEVMSLLLPAGHF